MGMRNLIVGKGEVGSSLYEVLSAHTETFIKDVEDLELNDVDFLHVCFPPSANFEAFVRNYQAKYQPKVTIIHSTVPVGTSRRLNAVHSPIHGKHPNLASGILTFKKYVGGADQKAVNRVKKLYRACKIKFKVVTPEESELSKLLCTTRLGWEVLYSKWVKEMCDKHGANYDVVYGWNKHYNKGYTKLKMPQYHRSLLKYMPGAIGGHCVINNAKLISDEVIPAIILNFNEKYMSETIPTETTEVDPSVETSPVEPTETDPVEVSPVE